jgi:hypothetical protein
MEASHSSSLEIGAHGQPLFSRVCNVHHSVT